MVLAGSAWLALDASGFAMVNLGLVVVWLFLARALVKRNRQLALA